MAAKRVNPNAVKLHYSYSVTELARCCGVHKNTIGNWQAGGLKPIDKVRPALFQGTVVRDYRPDFIARDTAGVIWIIETKGREDLNDPRKWERLKLWCEDANEQDGPRRYRALFVREEAWGSLLNPVRTLSEAEAAFGEK